MDQPRIVSIHEYELRHDADGRDLLRAAEEARDRGLFELPGLIGFRILHGIKGVRRGRFAAIWVYKDRVAWESLWGSPASPKGKEEYPPAWQEWEQELLAPLLDRDPDRVSFTSYEELLASSSGNSEADGR